MDSQTNIAHEIIEVEGVHGYVDKNGVVHILIDDVARGLGFVDYQEKFSATSGRKIYEVIRWARINDYLRELDCLSKDDPDVKSGDYIPEFWFYMLAMKAKNATAKKFQKKVAYEIMPSIRKHGYYSLNATPVPAVKPAKVKNPNRVAGQLTPAGVYISLMRNKTFKFAVVKVGQSNDVEERLSQVAAHYGLTVDKIYKTALLPRKVALAVERACKRILSPFKLEGEFFSVDYETALGVITALEKLFVDLSKIYNFERDDKVLKIAERILVESVNLITDKKVNLIAGKKN